MEEATKNLRGSIRFGALAAAALGVALAAGGCASKQETDQLRADKQQLTQEKQKLADEKQALADKLQSIQTESADANATLEDVQKGLEDIRARELKIVQSSIRVAQEANTGSERRDKLAAEIQMVRAAIRQNLQKLARLEKTNKENGVQMASLNALADELKRSLEEKDATVASLEAKVTDLSRTVETQTASIAAKDTTIQEHESTIAQRTKDLNTAYVAVASKDTLKSKGVVERRGDIAGLGGRWIETGKFDPAVFHEIDVTKDMEVAIPAPASKVRVVTGQPKGSYEIVDGGPNSKTSKLSVKDPSAFWKGDRYLVVMIPN